MRLEFGIVSPTPLRSMTPTRMATLFVFLVVLGGAGAQSTAPTGLCRPALTISVTCGDIRSAESTSPLNFSLELSDGRWTEQRRLANGLNRGETAAQTVSDLTLLPTQLNLSLGGGDGWALPSPPSTPRAPSWCSSCTAPKLLRRFCLAHLSS